MHLWILKGPHPGPHLVRVTAWVLRFVSKCHNKDKRTSLEGELLSVDEISTAEDFWIKRIQVQAYPDDLARLLAGKEIHLSSDLKSLHPLVDENGILRVGGRLDRAPISYEAKHPAILPKKSDIVPLILSSLHQRLNHAGAEHVLTELRQRFLGTTRAIHNQEIAQVVSSFVEAEF